MANFGRLKPVENNGDIPFNLRMVRELPASQCIYGNGHGFDYAQPHAAPMSSLSILDATFIGTVLEGLLYGLYSVVFVLYIRVHTSKKSVDRNILIYPLSTLFILCTVYFVLDFIQQFLTIMRGQNTLTFNLNMTTSAMFSFIDFISQGVLIYRCWVVWNHRLLVVVIPLILSLTSLATSLTLVVELRSIGQFGPEPGWFTPVGTSSFSLSLAVNAIFTGLLVYKIAKASLEFRHSLSHKRHDLRPLVSILIESGIVLFAAQLVWVIFFSTGSNCFYLVGGPVIMLYGTIPTLIVVRVGIRDADDHQTSSVESNMRFALADENSPTKISGNVFQWNSRLSRTLYPRENESKEMEDARL